MLAAPPSQEESSGLCPRDADVGVEVSPAGAAGRPGRRGAWLGVRGRPGVLRGAYQYEVELVGECLLRIGWATGSSTRNLGADALSFGFGGTAKKAHAGGFEAYGEPFERRAGAVVTCLLDRREPQAQTISYCLDGRSLGVAFQVPAELVDVPLFPALCGKGEWRAACRFDGLKFGCAGYRDLGEALLAGDATKGEAPIGKQRPLVGDQVRTEQGALGWVLRIDGSAFPYLVDKRDGSWPTWMRAKQVALADDKGEPALAAAAVALAGEGDHPGVRVVRKETERCLSDKSLQLNEVLHAKLSAAKPDGWIEIEVLLSCPGMQMPRVTVEDVRQAVSYGGSPLEIRDSAGTWQIRRAGGAPLPRLGRPGGKLLSAYSVGGEVEGRVTNLTSFGVFFDIGCVVDALLPLKRDEACPFNRGDTVMLKVLKVDEEKTQIAVEQAGLCMPQPAADKNARPAVGDTVWLKGKKKHGKVLKDDGSAVPFYVELEDGTFTAWCRACEVQVVAPRPTAATSGVAAAAAAPGAAAAGRPVAAGAAAPGTTTEPPPERSAALPGDRCLSQRGSDEEEEWELVGEEPAAAAEQRSQVGGG